MQIYRKHELLIVQQSGSVGWGGEEDTGVKKETVKTLSVIFLG